MSRTLELSTENLLRFLQVKNEPASTNDIARGLHLGKSDRQPLFKILAKLKNRNAIEELPGGRYRLAERKPGKEDVGSQVQQRKDDAQNKSATELRRDEIRGRLVLHHDGYGFVVPSTPMPQLDGDLFIPRDAIEGAMHGDQVVAKSKQIGGFTGARRAEGSIVRILGRAHLSVVGLFRYGSRGNVVLPYDIRIQHQVEIPPGDELTPALREKLGLAGLNGPGSQAKRLPQLPELNGAVVNVELTRYSR